MLVLFCVILLVGELFSRMSITTARQRARGLMWWRMLGSPLVASTVVEHCKNSLWSIMRGATRISRPKTADLSERYSELLADNIGQPGFRELLITVHDMDARRDVVIGLLSDPFHRPFFVRRPGHEGVERQFEVLDPKASARSHLIDAMAASLCLPVATEAHRLRFNSESIWKGETHRLCDRPEGVVRLLEEVVKAGAEQVIFVTCLLYTSPSPRD